MKQIAKTNENNLVEQGYSKHRTLEYREILEKYGFNVKVEKNEALYARGDFNYTINNKEVEFSLDAWGNWGLSFYDSLAIEVPEDVLYMLRARYGLKIKDRIPIPDIHNYFYLEGSKSQMDKELEKLLLGIAKYKYAIENADDADSNTINKSLTSSISKQFKKIKFIFRDKRELISV